MADWNDGVTNCPECGDDTFELSCTFGARTSDGWRIVTSHMSCGCDLTGEDYTGEMD